MVVEGIYYKGVEKAGEEVIFNFNRRVYWMYYEKTLSDVPDNAVLYVASELGAGPPVT